MKLPITEISPVPVDSVETRRAIVEFSAVTDGQLSVEFEHTRAEFTAALRAVMRRGRPFQVIAGVGAVLTAVGLLATLSGGDDGGWTVIGGSVLAWAAFMYVYCPLAQWRNEALFRGPRTPVDFSSCPECRSSAPGPISAVGR